MDTSFPIADPDDETLQNATRFMDDNGNAEEGISFEIGNDELKSDVPPAGTYNVVAVDFKVKEGPKGKYCSIGWKILDPSWRNKWVWSNHSVSAGAQAITAQQMLNIGVPYEEIEDPITGTMRKKFDIRKSTVLNKLARVKVDNGTWEGRTTTNVKGVNAPNQETARLAEEDPDLV